MRKTPVLAVVGPTASGKSALGLALARELGGEIVCMDSMQVYRRMDIGTAKPTRAERSAAPHHLLDVAEPSQAFTVADYADRAKPLLSDIAARGKLPILVGGTGLYYRALARGMPLGGARGDEAVRQRLWAVAEEENGRERLHERLRAVDPVTAARLHPNDLRRVIRALEVCEVTGSAMSRQNEAAPESPFAFCPLGVTMAREALYARIERRVDGMMAAGLLEEVEGLLREGVPPAAQAMRGIGYKELVPVLTGGLSLADAVDTLKRNTRRYAKRQWTWFGGEKGIRWLDGAAPGAEKQALEIARSFWEARKNREDGIV